MTDHPASETRSRVLASVRLKDTGPETTVSRLLHRKRHRYGLHRRDLGGRPELVFGPRHNVVFVHGCFWRGHDYPKGRLRTRRVGCWSASVSKNRARDARNVCGLVDPHPDVYVVPEFETACAESLGQRVVQFLAGDLS